MASGGTAPHFLRRTPQGVRGLKPDPELEARDLDACRTPQGVRGLKQVNPQTVILIITHKYWVSEGVPT